MSCNRVCIPASEDIMASVLMLQWHVVQLFCIRCCPLIYLLMSVAIISINCHSIVLDRFLAFVTLASIIHALSAVVSDAVVTMFVLDMEAVIGGCVKSNVSCSCSYSWYRATKANWWFCYYWSLWLWQFMVKLWLIFIAVVYDLWGMPALLATETAHNTFIMFWQNAKCMHSECIKWVDYHL